jgi:hypothetical protein
MKNMGIKITNERLKYKFHFCIGIKNNLKKINAEWTGYLFTHSS